MYSRGRFTTVAEKGVEDGGRVKVRETEGRGGATSDRFRDLAAAPTVKTADEGLGFMGRI